MRETHSILFSIELPMGITWRYITPIRPAVSRFGTIEINHTSGPQLMSASALLNPHGTVGLVTNRETLFSNRVSWHNLPRPQH